MFAQGCALGTGQCRWLGDITTSPSRAVPFRRCSNSRSPSDPSFTPQWSCTKPLDLVQFCLSVACLLKQLFCVCPRKKKSLFLLMSLRAGPAQEIIQEQHHEIIFPLVKIINMFFGHRKWGELQEPEPGLLCL